MHWKNPPRGLFAFPAQSNASGVKHDLCWVQKAEECGWDVLLDVSAFVPSSVLDLSEIKPAFVVMSFYKMFGYPTGMGCLLVRNTHIDKLKKTWFAGGTVMAASVKTDHYKLLEGHERYEDGTINFLSIPAIKIGLDFLKSIGMLRIQQRIQSLQKYLHHELSRLQHESGLPIIKIHGPSDRSNCGGNIMITVLDALGQPYPFIEIEEKANAYFISLRSGCFCNPGVDEYNHDLTQDSLEKYFQSEINDPIHLTKNSAGKWRGAVRISVGVPTRKKDLDRFIAFVLTFKDKIRP